MSGDPTMLRVVHSNDDVIEEEHPSWDEAVARATEIEAERHKDGRALRSRFDWAWGSATIERMQLGTNYHYIEIWRLPV